MRVKVVAAFLAVAAVPGFAGAIPMEVEPPEGLPLGMFEGVLVLDPASVEDEVAERAGAVASLASIAPRKPGAPDVVPRASRYFLLPDASLVQTLDGRDPGLYARGVPVRAAAPVDPAALRLSRAASPLELPPAVAPAGVEGALDVPAPRAQPETLAPADDARVFVPPPGPRAGAPTVVFAGGLAFAVAAVAAALYHRIRPNAALENQTRKIIFDSVCSQPGLGVHEISKIAGVSYSTATYHLERLVGAGMLVMTPNGNKLCYYKNGGAFSESERRILPLLKNDEAAKLFEAILDTPGTYRAELAGRLGVTATTINWHLRRLRAAGLVDETRSGRSAHLTARVDALRPTLQALLGKVQDCEPDVADRIRRYLGPSQEPGVGAA